MDSKTCEKLYRTYYMKVFSYLCTLSGDRDLAEELSQETFSRALTAGSDFRGESDEGTWLCAIAKNLFHDEMRRRGKTAELSDETCDTLDVELSAVDADSAFRIHLALHALEEPYREVFELRIFGELSFRQIGAIFGKTENWARVTYHRARLKLQERLDTK